jgi:thimet oligopeptidase
VKHLSITVALAMYACGGTATQPAPATAAPGAAVKAKSEVSQEFDRTCRADLADAQAKLAALEALTGPKTVATVLEALNAINIIIDRDAGRSSLFAKAHPDADLREAADACEQEFAKLATNIGLSRPLYDAVAAMDVSKEDAVTQRYVKNLLRNFRRAGVDKDPATRERIRALQDELVKIGQEFDKNIREDVRSIKVKPAELAGMPEDWIAEHKPGADGLVTITTDYPDYVPFMTYADSDARRLEIYKEFRKRAHPKNIAVLDTMLAKRHELAQLVGYKTWAQYVTEDKMMKSDEAARAFVEKVAGISKKRADRDIGELLARLKKIDPKATAVGDWQKAYLENLVKKESYALDSQVVRKYFTFAKAREGLFRTTAQMFGVEYRKVDAPVWHPSVEAYDLVDKGQVIARFYLDMFPREAKYKHAAAFSLVSGVEGKQRPEAALVCNFPAEGPMEHDDVETFFHEFGHLIHHLFAQHHHWVGVSGFSTELDFVEAPSQIFEEWAWDPASLKSFASDETGKPIPDDLIKAMRRARDFGKGTQVRHQMFYASVSLSYYDRDPKGLDTTAKMKELQGKYSPFPYVDDTFFQLSFGHLDGYSAMYYTYMWSLVIAKDLFSRFEKEGVTSPAVALRYRQKVLEPGGSKDAADLVTDFLGRPFAFDAFAAWLNRDG